MRVYARTQIEENMRAQFEQNLCAKDQINGDVCVAFPKEGRCISGEYINPVEVWNWPRERSAVEAIMRKHYARLGSPRKFANWLACQGFERIKIKDRVGIKTGDAEEWSVLIHFFSYCSGACIWDIDKTDPLFKGIFGMSIMEGQLKFTQTNEIRSIYAGGRSNI